MTGSWFPIKPRAEAKIRLFTLPYAGGGASIYYGWQKDLPDWLQVCPIQLPGREERYHEPRFRDLLDCAESLLEVLDLVLDRPMALFGHSMGALLALELARQLEARGRPPRMLFVSGAGAPGPGRVKPISMLPDAAFDEELRAFAGTPERILNDSDMMQVYRPLLRADLAMAEGYKFEGRLGLPIEVLVGTEDPEVPLSDIGCWREVTSGEVEIRVFPGGHFYLREQEPALLAHITQKLLGVD